jgi:hypothetical protein
MGAPPRYIRRMIVFHPARASLADVQSRWGRIIAHDFTKHIESGRPLLMWHLRAWATLASAFVHAPVLLVSTRVPTLGARFRGLSVLFKTRVYRFGRMRRIVSEEHLDMAMQWNRAS